MDGTFFSGKKVLVTGHTGFKGVWLCEMLSFLGAKVTGYSLEPSTTPSLYNILRLDEKIKSIIGDVRDFESFKETFDTAQPEIVIHLAAQPLVRESYERPRYTFDTNVMGTVNLLECVRLTDSVKSVLNVTTDKVYRNNETKKGFTEEDELDGYDPYSNSKSCSELVTHCYKRSFLDMAGKAVSTARAGNVIGGGDFSRDRLIPDCIRAAISQEVIRIRNPYSIRPFQHVLEALNAYLLIIQKQYKNKEDAGYFNIGPDEKDCLSAGEIATRFCKLWDGASWEDFSEKGAPHEAGMLFLDCTKLKQKFNWKPRWSIEEALKRTVEWSMAYMQGENMQKITQQQIEDYLQS